jgi:sarcosine oxidase gamma subunit
MIHLSLERHSGERSHGNPETGCNVALLNSKEAPMGLAEYMIVSKPDGWTVLHDGTAPHDYDTKEAAFEAAVAAASLAIRQGHEVHVSVPGREAGNKTALGAKDPQNVP